MDNLEFEPQEWKLLFMVLAENRGKIDFRTALTPYGISLLDSIRHKLGMIVVDVDTGPVTMADAEICPTCLQPMTYLSTDPLVRES
jgi:hypothetical protein